MFCENSSMKLSSLEVFFVEAFVCIDSVCFITIWLFRLSICSEVSFGILISLRRFVHIKCQIYRQKVIHSNKQGVFISVKNELIFQTEFFY